MSHLQIAVAQVPSHRGDVRANVATHLGAIEKAASIGTSYIVFPELSLTGYEPELAQALAFEADDRRIRPLLQAAVAHRIYVVAGAPLATSGLPQIGALVIAPNGAIQTYAKMHLHPGEEEFFSVGGNHLAIRMGDTIIAHAICADANHPEHAMGCSQLGADIYAVGVLISTRGYAADTKRLQSYAREHGMLIAMANHNRPTGGWHPAGRSAIWAASGMIACADEKQSALVIGRRVANEWVGEVVAL